MPVSSPSYLPNLLSSLRIALAPGMVGAAHSDSKVGFIFLLGFAITTDLVDGHLARRWRAESPMGHRLDRWGDALTMCFGAIGIWFLWPASIEREWPWALVALGAYLVLGIDRLWLRPEYKRDPIWWEKVLGIMPPLTLIPLITEWSPWPFRGGAVLLVLVVLLKIGERNAKPDQPSETWPSLDGKSTGAKS